MPDPLAKSLPWFEQWQQETAIEVPDFAALPTFLDLPPLLQFLSGTPVQSLEDWEKRRTEIHELLCYYFFGSFPGSPPTLLDAELLHEQRESRAIRRIVELRFDTKPRASFTVETMTPEGEGPFPIFLTQTTHRAWALLALSRGYLACVYPAADEVDESLCFATAYPSCDWRTIPRRAWSAGRALDYLFSLPEVDQHKVGITGHSRNGKQALIATAIDPRITAVVSSSSGAGGICPFRFSSEQYFAESVEFMTRHFPDWFHPRLRFFTGREDRLPIDIHGLLSLVAPRPCLISSAYNDLSETLFAIERCYLANREVYRFLGQPEALSLRWRPGGHETRAEDIQAYLDFFDAAFGRRDKITSDGLINHFDWDAWRRHASTGVSSVDALPKGNARSLLHERVLWGLGEPPPITTQWGTSYGSEKSHDSALLRLSDPQEVAREAVVFSDYVAGHLYYPREVNGPLPVVIWLHPYSFPRGYTGAYIETPAVYHFLASNGFAVLAYDQLGFGARLFEGSGFQKRYPNWSKLGKMVRDVHGALDFIIQGNDHSSFKIAPKWLTRLPTLDTERVFCLGYALGGMVALYAAALDERIAGVASFCGLTPLRTKTNKGQVGAVERLCDWYGLQPRLGFFKGREQELPYDFEDVLSLIAPRDCLIVSPTEDYENNCDEVLRCVDNARPAWSQRGEQKLTVLTPQDYNRFGPDQHVVFLEWLEAVLSSQNALDQTTL